VIEFLCPNGHRIRCQPEQAGRAAKCPRCGVKFRVPQPTDEDVKEAGSSDSKFPRPEFIDSTGSSRKLPATGGATPSLAEIEFLCPNGHRLHGAVTLQGRPGACPECGSRFRIPTYEEISAEEELAHEINLGHVDGREGSDAGKRAAAETQRSLPTDLGPITTEATSTTVGSTTAHGMAALVARLWATRPAGATLDLRLRDGETIIPQQFLKRQSDENQQGIFVVKEADGSLSIVAVAWDAVARAAVRGLGELPADWTE
jgi:DNA-directed RNA polymerase subunit RPC12/RpoP